MAGSRRGDLVGSKSKGEVMLPEFVSQYMALWWEGYSQERIAEELGVTRLSLLRLVGDRRFQAFVREHAGRDLDEMTPLVMGKMRELIEGGDLQAIKLWGKWQGYEITRIQQMNINVDVDAERGQISSQFVEILRWMKRFGSLGREELLELYDAS